MVTFDWFVVTLITRTRTLDYVASRYVYVDFTLPICVTGLRLIYVTILLIVLHFDVYRYIYGCYLI